MASNVQLQRQIMLHALPVLGRAVRPLKKLKNVAVLEFCGRARRLDEPARHLVHTLRLLGYVGSIHLVRDDLRTSVLSTPSTSSASSSSTRTLAVLLDATGQPLPNVDVAQVAIALTDATSNTLYTFPLAPPASLDAAYSLATLQYLSRRPLLLDTGIFVHDDATDEATLQAFADQARDDLIGFIRTRATELRPSAPLVLSLMLKDEDDMGGGGEQLLSFFSAAVYQLYAEEHSLTQAQFHAMTLPLYLRRDDQVNATFARVKDVVFVQEYADRFVRIPSWGMFEDGTITQDAYATAAVAFVAPLTRAWTREALLAGSLAEDDMERTIDAIEREFRRRVRTATGLREARFRFGYVRLERL